MGSCVQVMLIGRVAVLGRVTGVRCLEVGQPCQQRAMARGLSISRKRKVRLRGSGETRNVGSASAMFRSRRRVGAPASPDMR